MKIGILSGKENLAYIEVKKEGTYIWIGLGLSLYSLTKKTRKKEEEQKKMIKLQTGKESDAPVTFTK